jgi:60 kDa SS-A/Ro ribonucleoprotein
MVQWELFKKQNPNAKLINIDTASYETTQVSDRGDIMNIGGFSDQVFEGIAEFVKGKYGAGAWLKLIEGIKVEA